MACSEWKVPWLPVKPWQMTLVDELTRMDIRLAPDCLDDLFGRIRKIVRRDDVQPGVADDLLAEIDVRALQPDHERDLQPNLLHRGENALGDDVAAHDAAEDVDEDALHVRVRRDD